MYCFLPLTSCLSFVISYALKSKIYSLYRCLSVLSSEQQYSSICCHIIDGIKIESFLLNQSMLIYLFLGSDDCAIYNNVVRYLYRHCFPVLPGLPKWSAILLLISLHRWVPCFLTRVEIAWSSCNKITGYFIGPSFSIVSHFVRM